ncbi:hypothetical protein UPYG_G00146840 [Umbra pygmaea]|uniref:V-set and immunoglobulin domain-containing protein 10-like n=1 Tax=Umbra pygmaea TaxID=75934 RepID=A0ABD0WWP0_UMBPY
MPSHQFCVHTLFVFKVTLWLFVIKGLNCALTISLRGPSLVNATVGSNVTLGVTILGAPHPVVTWKMGSLPVVTWNLGSTDAPSISPMNQDVLKIEADGSLVFKNVPLVYSNTYTLEVVKVGMETALTKFLLKVYDYIYNVSVSATPVDAVEGTATFSLQYSSVPGEADQWRWYFNSVEIQNSSHYTVNQKSLVISQPNRTDTGLYTLVLANPFSAVTSHRNITVLYGPDEPVLEVSPSQAFFVSGESLSLSCQAVGIPLPSASWMFGGQTLVSQEGCLNLTDVQTNQGGVYTCEVLNRNTGVHRRKNLTLNVYERPKGEPLCLVYATSGIYDLQFHCQWQGGTPEAWLSFPALNSTAGGAGELILTTPASQDLNGRTVVCRASHPLHQSQCNVTACGPANFLPKVTTMEQNGQIVVCIQCYSPAMPSSIVTWSKGSELLASGTQYQINKDTTQLSIFNFNSSTAPLHTYTCNCGNPLGNTSKYIQLLGPTISNFHVFPNGDGSAVTITWEIPPTSVITGFDIQMRGPSLLAKHVRRRKRANDNFRSIQQEPGTSRSTNISALDSKSTYYFRVIPFAGETLGLPSVVLRLGPVLSQPQVIGLAAGIPCGVLFILLLVGFICLCVYCSRRKRDANRYPVARAVEKVVSTQTHINTPSCLLTGGIKDLPDYNRKITQGGPTERCAPLPRFVYPPPVRTATIV